MSTLYVSRGAVEGCCYFWPRRLPNTRLHRAPISPAAGRACPALHCGTGRRRASAGAFPTAEGSASRGVRAASQTTRAVPTPPQSSCSCLGGHVRNRCSLFTLPHSHAIPGAACGRVGTVLAQDWHSARRPFAPRELRMHPGVGITSHGWEPARGFDDLPHWQGAICFPNDQCRSLPRGATFEAIPGEWRRILVPDGDCAAACSGGKRTMPVFFSGATLPTLLGADRRVVCGCT